MELKPGSEAKIAQLLKKGVEIPNPLTLDIGDDVTVDQISAKGVTLYPGCRIYGKTTVISAGCKLGYEAPATVENCQLGAGVELKGGYFSSSVFLEKSNMGMGAHVREGSILEEHAGGAHCVGLKQTILFPFVTLGSLINFCDCLMAGGRSRQDHSEVGSSYIHFNFTPDADKATPSLIGDVPRGVMLNQPPIFLGGQGGMIGPTRLGYGNVVAAGCVLRGDYPEDNKLIYPPAGAGGVKDFVPAAYPGFKRVVENNILYLANLAALEAWYRGVRKPFLEAQEFGTLLFAGVMDQLAAAGKERLKRLEAMAEKAVGPGPPKGTQASVRSRREFHAQLKSIGEAFHGRTYSDATERNREAFLKDFRDAAGNDRANYIATIQGLPAKVSSKGIRWLAGLVNDICAGAAKALPSMQLFKNQKRIK
ncbi:MAG TPA: UDP-N-acetylglucosamine pyrophosphorylase [Syntrophales bacterium]|nr:UDP-N-acetylglucosamine pyrophosphorylase [Syntrophales bacterium]HOX93462.1 UDP-N-acetylglucosamine pyrophosphorylase [Syntrophales bacterium]HPI57569.1 UDP-N-acetylglucosamine pyrophosphorylase [Syntrophales bacterium]HPN24726.1 UDP-N-acetylglucosamine pyrophosphorylase [Syntrophales bacterium]HQM29856.1 UDP-N-acetylglucosamine pyrophosphorylase [Syntrophales bacterium]